MSEIVIQGVELAAFGMATVFVFLTLLVLATMGMSSLVMRFSDEPAPVTPARRSAPADEDRARLVAITAAVRRYRDTH